MRIWPWPAVLDVFHMAAVGANVRRRGQASRLAGHNWTPWPLSILNSLRRSVSPSASDVTVSRTCPARDDSQPWSALPFADWRGVARVRRRASARGQPVAALASAAGVCSGAWLPQVPRGGTRRARLCGGMSWAARQTARSTMSWLSTSEGSARCQGTRSEAPARRASLATRPARSSTRRVSLRDSHPSPGRPVARVGGLGARAGVRPGAMAQRGQRGAR